jgi:hypothetical protein
VTALPAPILSLEQRRENIVEKLQKAALDVGFELISAKYDHPGRFIAWVEAELPFGVDKAERLMAIARSFADLAPESRNLLPPAWSALFELSRLPSERFQEALEAGEVHPGLTVAQSRALADRSPEIHPNHHPVRIQPPETGPKPGLTCNAVAAALTKLPRGDLSPEMEGQLRTWLDRSSTTT